MMTKITIYFLYLIENYKGHTMDFRSKFSEPIRDFILKLGLIIGFVWPQRIFYFKFTESRRTAK